MSREELLAALRQRPFKPLTVFLSDGRTFDLRNPEFMWVGHSTAVIFTPALDLPPPAYARYDTVSLYHITGLQLQDEPELEAHA